jgi:hypothetical protein
LTRHSKSALKIAPLLMVSTQPPRVVLLAGSETEPIDLGRYDLPEGAGVALAAFFTAGLANLAVRVQSMVSLALASERAQLMASLRPDRWEAKCLSRRRFGRSDVAVHAVSSARTDMAAVNIPFARTRDATAGRSTVTRSRVTRSSD